MSLILTEYISRYHPREPMRWAGRDWYELSRAEIITQWRGDAHFHRFSVRTSAAGEHTLICEIREGRTWFALGTLSQRPPELPEWVGRGP
jgi:hypothetical protein